MKKDSGRPGQSRRQVLVAGAALAASVSSVRAETFSGKLPWTPGATSAPRPIDTSAWHFFTADEAASVQALVDRLIPPDPETAGGKDSGCAAFIDGQLAGPYGSAKGLYMEGPFQAGTPQQGPQDPATSAELYRAALKSLDDYCHANFDGKAFAELEVADQDALLAGFDGGAIALDGVDAKLFFELLLQNTMEGFFSDPLYGGNRDMAGWKMIGFPGSRYDYREYVEQHNQTLDLPPVSIRSKL
jgi:gluconate 2-dehydrogenase gamma chain